MLIMRMIVMKLKSRRKAEMKCECGNELHEEAVLNLCIDCFEDFINNLDQEIERRKANEKCNR
jgi:uncharacterized small protein (DUF1192 family)